MLSVAFFSHGQGRAGGSIEWIRKIGESSGKNPLFFRHIRIPAAKLLRTSRKAFRSRINPFGMMLDLLMCPMHLKR